MRDQLWKPSPRRIASSNLTRFTRWLQEQTGREFQSYADLHRWSVTELDDFWFHFLEYSGIPWSGQPRPVLRKPGMPGAEWFPGLSLDFPGVLTNGPFNGPAIVAASEDPESTREIHPAELRRQVAQAAAAFRQLGVGPGDRIAGYVSNVPEAAVACLAAASLGAVWSSASPDFGLGALAQRLNQVEPRLLLASVDYQYGGRRFSTLPVLDRIRDEVPSIEAMVAVGEGSLGACDLHWNELLVSGSNNAEIAPEMRPFATPLYILFSSGTTGPPKCMIHGAGGTLLQHLKELSLHCNLGPRSRLLYFTTCGWMMWNWQLSALALGTTIVLYDGSPAYPSLGALWERARDLGITHLGTSGRYIESCMKGGFQLDPGSEEIESVLYTGSPLSPAGFRWVYDSVGADLHLAGISGGTDIVSCFVLGNPNLPVHAGEIQCPGLGVDVAALGDDGAVVKDRPGELVCRKPLPSMPLGFLGDPDRRRYRETYFDRFPGVWAHGDFVEMRSKTGGIVIYGRSDATLNPGGVRIGAAEIYSALHSVAEVTGALAVGWKPPGQADEKIILLVTTVEPTPSARPADEDLARRTRAAVRREASPRHVPHAIFVVRGLPVTRSGKLVELGVKAVLAGCPMDNREALADPSVMEDVEAVRRLLVESV